MVPTRWGTQPGWALCTQADHSIRKIADEIGVPYAHLGNALTGRIIPNDDVREKLPAFLGVPLEELFTSDVLAQKHDEKRGKYTRRSL